VIACLALAGCTRLGLVPFVVDGDGGSGLDSARVDGPRVDGPGTDGARADGAGVDGAVTDTWGLEGGLSDWGSGAEAGPFPAKGLLAAWPLDNGSGQVVSAAVGSDGYLGKSASADSADPAWDKTPARRWFGAALTFDGGDRRLRADKDGKQTTYLRQDVLKGSLRTTTNPWRIGNESNGVRGFDGTIDDIRVFNRVLSLAEIGALSNLGPP